MVVSDVLVPLKVQSGAWTSLRTYDTENVAYGGLVTYLAPRAASASCDVFTRVCAAPVRRRRLCFTRNEPCTMTIGPGAPSPLRTVLCGRPTS
jgi:hypothetical protein